MSRSVKKSIAIPQPVRDGLCAQIDNGTLKYPSENAAWIGLARYQLLIGKPHPVTVAISRMHADEQDTIDDFLQEIATRGLALRGTLLEHLIRRAIDGSIEPTCQGTAELVPLELLKLAREWRKNPVAVIARLAPGAGEPACDDHLCTSSAHRASSKGSRLRMVPVTRLLPIRTGRR